MTTKTSPLGKLLQKQREINEKIEFAEKAARAADDAKLAAAGRGDKAGHEKARADFAFTMDQIAALEREAEALEPAIAAARAEDNDARRAAEAEELAKRIAAMTPHAQKADAALRAFEDALAAPLVGSLDPGARLADQSYAIAMFDALVASIARLEATHGSLAPWYRLLSDAIGLIDPAATCEGKLRAALTRQGY
jgi:hypothetical protein